MVGIEQGAGERVFADINTQHENPPEERGLPHPCLTSAVAAKRKLESYAAGFFIGGEAKRLAFYSRLSMTKQAVHDKAQRLYLAAWRSRLYLQDYHLTTSFNHTRRSAAAPCWDDVVALLHNGSECTEELEKITA